MCLTLQTLLCSGKMCRMFYSVVATKFDLLLPSFLTFVMYWSKSFKLFKIFPPFNAAWNTPVRLQFNMRKKFRIRRSWTISELFVKKSACDMNKSFFLHELTRFVWHSLLNLPNVFNVNRQGCPYAQCLHHRSELIVLKSLIIHLITHFICSYNKWQLFTILFRQTW